MADLITIKGGNGNVPTLQDRELAYRKDEKALYIGTESGNVRLCGAEDVTNIDALNASIEAINTLLADITARLDALETPSE